MGYGSFGLRGGKTTGETFRARDDCQRQHRARSRENAMDDFQLNFYAGTLATQCDFAMLAARDVERVWTTSKLAWNGPRCEQQTDMLRQWYAVQGLLQALGNASKLLWPAPAGWLSNVRKDFALARGEALREKLRMNEREWKLSDRKFRNAFEHLDEWLDEWAADPERNRQIADMMSGMAAEQVGLPGNQQFRVLDPSTWTLFFLGDKFDLIEALDEVRDLRNRLENRFWPDLRRS